MSTPLPTRDCALTAVVEYRGALPPLAVLQHVEGSGDRPERRVRSHRARSASRLDSPSSLKLDGPIRDAGDMKYAVSTELETLIEVCFRRSVRSGGGGCWRLGWPTRSSAGCRGSGSRYPRLLMCQAALVARCTQAVCSSYVLWWRRQPARMPTSRLDRARSAWWWVAPRARWLSLKRLRFDAAPV